MKTDRELKLLQPLAHTCEGKTTGKRAKEPSSPTLVWETVGSVISDSARADCPDLVELVSSADSQVIRAAVPGGWLVRVVELEELVEEETESRLGAIFDPGALAFVPDPQHSWK